MKVCLVNPPSGFLLDERVFLALGALKVAAVLENADYVVDYLDLAGVRNYETACRDYVSAHLLQFGTTRDLVFGITATTPQIPAAIKIRQCLQGKVILGGPHATLLNAAARRGNRRAQEAMANLLSAFDVVVAGDGERAIFRALREYGLIDADDPKSDLWMSSKDFTESPWPARHLVDVDSYHYSIDGERAIHLIGQLGCPMHCTFCAGRNSPMLRRMRLRKPEDIIAEVEFLHQQYGFKGFNFFDDELNINKLVVPLMRGLKQSAIERGVEWRLRGFLKAELFTEEQAQVMYDAGFRWVLIGFESGSERILLNIQKNATRDENTRAIEIAHKYGLKVKALMSIAHAGESEETLLETEKWILQTRPDELDITVITPYPGCPYWDDASEIAPGIWCYESPKTKDRLYMEQVDFSVTADFYKGVSGNYVSHVWTDFLSKEDLVSQRDELELSLRSILNIPFPQANTSIVYDASMGMTSRILRSSGDDKCQEDRLRLKNAFGLKSISQTVVGNGRGT